MLVREGGHEIVAVVIVGLHAQVDALVVARLLGRSDEVLWQQLLLLVEVVAGTLDRRWLDKLQYSGTKGAGSTHHINQQLQRALPLLHQLGGIVLPPLGLVLLTEVALEGLLPPGAVDGVGNGREGGSRLVLARVLQELQAPVLVNQLSDCVLSGSTYQRQGAVAAHAVAGDADPAAVQNLKVREQRLGQLLRDVGVHVVALVIGRVCRVDVEPGATTKIVSIVFALDAQATCRGRGGTG